MDSYEKIEQEMRAVRTQDSILHRGGEVVESHYIADWADRIAAMRAISPEPSNGYIDWFYEVTDMLNIAKPQPVSPKQVWETQMRPQLQALIAQSTPAIGEQGEAVAPGYCKHHRSMDLICNPCGRYPAKWAEPVAGVSDVAIAEIADSILTDDPVAWQQRFARKVLAQWGAQADGAAHPPTEGAAHG